MNRINHKKTKINLSWVASPEFYYWRKSLPVHRAIAIVKVYVLLLLEADVYTRAARLSLKEFEHDTKLSTSRVQQALLDLLAQEWIYQYQSQSATTLYFVNDMVPKGVQSHDISEWVEVETAPLLKLLRHSSNARLSTIEQFLQTFATAYAATDSQSHVDLNTLFNLGRKAVAIDTVILQPKANDMKRGRYHAYRHQQEQDIRQQWLRDL